MSLNDIGLWRYNAITGYWKHERNCNNEVSGRWLEIFQQDEPHIAFCLSKYKPSKKPRLYDFGNYFDKLSQNKEG